MAQLPWETIIKAAEEGGYGEAAPAGRYTVRVDSAESKMSSNNNPMIVCKLKVTVGPHSGKRVTSPFDHSITMSEKAAGMFMGNMAAFGITGEMLTKHRPTMAQIAKAIQGRTAEVITEVDPKRKTREGGEILQVKGTLRRPAENFSPVTVFPKVTEAESLGYGAPSAPSAPTAPAAPSVPTAPSPSF